MREKINLHTLEDECLILVIFKNLLYFLYQKKRISYILIYSRADLANYRQRKRNKLLFALLACSYIKMINLISSTK